MKRLEAVRADGVAHIVFGSFLRSDFLEKSISIHFAEADYEVYKVYLSHYKLGSLVWESNRGSKEMHRWESEEQAQADSFLNKHFTQILANGLETDDTHELALVYSILDAVKASTDIDEAWKHIIAAVLMNVRKNAPSFKLPVPD